MLNLDPGKLLIIAVVAVILLGPDKLPQFARQVGGAWRTFNDFRHRMETEVRSSIPDLPSSAEIARLARSPSALLNHLSTLGQEDGAPADPLTNPSPITADAAVSDVADAATEPTTPDYRPSNPSSGRLPSDDVTIAAGDPSLN
jgi:sec-independent protein translocase protein TatB